MLVKKNKPNPVIKEELLSGFDIQDWNQQSFAREFYDNIGQILSLAKMRLATLNPEKKDETRQIVEQSSLLITKALKDLRSLARQMTPAEIMNHGFVASICKEIERLHSTGICKTSYHIQGLPFRLEPVRELILFSILHHYIYTGLYIEKCGSIRVSILFLKQSVRIEMNCEIPSVIPESKAGFTTSSSLLKRTLLANATIREQREIGKNKILLLVKRKSG